MYPGIYRWILRGACLYALLHPSGAVAEEALLTIAAAANVQFAMEEIKAEFEQATGIGIKAVYGASGKLTTQIRQGAPFDVLVSADMDFPDTLHRSGYAIGAPGVYAYGKLVVWTLRGTDLSRGLDRLRDPALRKVAVADPKRAPYGKEAVKALQRAGIHGAVLPKLVYGENVAQVGQFLMTGNVGAAITAKSAVLAPQSRGKGAWAEVDSALYDRIAQGAVICRHGQDHHPILSARFHAFLYSGPARRILLRHGYALP